MKELLNSSERIAVFVGVISVSIPVIVFITTWFFKVVQKKVVDEINAKQEKRDLEIEEQQRKRDQERKEDDLKRQKELDAFYALAEAKDKLFEKMIHTVEKSIDAMEKSINAVEESVKVIKEDGAQRKIEFDTSMKALDLHIEELKHVNYRLETHDIEIDGIKKLINERA